MKKINLTQGKFALVDDADFEHLNQWKWGYQSDGYAFRATTKAEKLRDPKKYIYMHILINQTPNGFETEHRDGNGLNNQRSNLRTATHAQNCQNRKVMSNGTSQYKGVSWHTKAGKWTAQIGKDGKSNHLGCFEVEREAAQTYDKKALEMFGKFARTNF